MVVESDLTEGLPSSSIFTIFRFFRYVNTYRCTDEKHCQVLGVWNHLGITVVIQHSAARTHDESYA